MINLDVENLDPEAIFEQFANHHYSVETAYCLWNGRQVSEEIVFEIESAAKKIHEFFFSYDQESEEFEVIWQQLATLGDSVSDEDYESLGLYEIIPLIPEFKEELDDFSNLDSIEFGIFSSIGRKVSEIWKKYKKEIIIGTAVVVVIAITAGAASAAGAAAVGTAGGVAADKNKNSDKSSRLPPVKKQPPSASNPAREKPGYNPPPSPINLPPTQETPPPPSTSKYPLPPLQWKTEKASEIFPLTTSKHDPQLNPTTPSKRPQNNQPLTSKPPFLEPPPIPSKPVKKETLSDPLQTLQTKDKPLHHLPSLNTKLPATDPFKLDPLPLPPLREINIANVPPVLLPQERVLAATFVPDFTSGPDIMETYTFSSLEHSAGLSVGLAKGCWDSVGGFCNLAKELSLHPSEVIFGAINGIAELSKMLLSKDWEGLSQALVPEIRQLVLDWDKLSDYQREERTGHAVGKLGFDIIAPGALAKALAKGFKGVEALKSAYQNLQAAKEVYLIEALATAERQALGITHKAETAIANAERGVSSASEIAQLKGAVTASEEIAAIEEILHGLACSRAEFERYQAFLRTQMEKPFVYDAKLKKLVDVIFREEAEIGNGSTAAAIRYEKLTGQAVKGSYHTIKGEQMIKALERWLKNNPTAKARDQAAAENIIKDLKNALGD